MAWFSATQLEWDRAAIFGIPVVPLVDMSAAIVDLDVQASSNVRHDLSSEQDRSSKEMHCLSSPEPSMTTM